MKSHNTYLGKNIPVVCRGITLIEILIVIGIMSLLAGYGVIIGIDSLTRYNFHAESDNAVVMLESARSKSINNIGGQPHGVYFDTAGRKLIVFRGSTHSTSVTEAEISMQPAFVYDASDCAAGEAVFAQLSGDVSDCEIKIINGTNEIIITLNNEGGIDY